MGRGMVKSPCFDVRSQTDCPNRSPGCAATCLEWQKYLEKRDAVYKERYDEGDIKDVIRARTNRINKARQKKRIPNRR